MHQVRTKSDVAVHVSVAVQIKARSVCTQSLVLQRLQTSRCGVRSAGNLE
jgi:hypothetical protein